MDPRWDTTDCEVTPELVAALLRTQLPRAELVPGSVRYFDDGCDSWVYVATFAAGGEWMLRFPKRAEVAAHLEREIRLLPALATTLSLPVPRFELVGQPSSTYPHSFVGYPRLPGRAALACAGETFDVEGVGALPGDAARIPGTSRARTRRRA